MPPCERGRSTAQESLLPASACVAPAPAPPAVHVHVGLPAPQQQRRASNDAETRNLLVDLKLQLAHALQKVDELTQANKCLVNEVALLKKQNKERPCTCTKEDPTCTAVADGTKSPVGATSRSDTTRGKFDPSLGYGSSNIRKPSTTSTAGPLEALGGAASVRNMFSSLRRESLMTMTTESSQTGTSSESRRNSQSSLLRAKEKREKNKGGNDDDQDGPIWLQKLRNLPGSSTKDLSCRDDTCSNMSTNNLTGHKHERMPRRGSSSAPNILSISPSALAHFNESTLNLMALDDMSESMNNTHGKDPPPDALPSHVAACGTEFTAPLSAVNNPAVPLKRNNTENDVKSFMRRMSGLSDDFSISDDDDSFGGDYKNAAWTELP